MVKEKRCTTCKTVKPLTEFYKRKRYKDGLTSGCSECSIKRVKEYRRTKKGLITKIYSSQKGSSKKRGHKPPTYTKTELYNFSISSDIFNQLYKDWVISGYKKMLSPSFDRLDDSKGYSFSNFNKWMTWQENSNKGRADMRAGKLTSSKPQKAVIQLTKDNEYVAEFVSQQQAARVTGVNHSHICSVTLGKRKTTGGFKWINKL